MLIAMLDGLRQGDGLWDDQRRTPRLPVRIGFR